MGFVRDLAHRQSPSFLRVWTGLLHGFITTARRYVLDLADGISSAAVENLLKPTSLTITMVRLRTRPSSCIEFQVTVKNAFNDALSDTFDIYSVLPVDLMHEVELGVWKSLLTHLIRILYSVGMQVVTELDSRYVPPHLLSHYLLIHLPDFDK